MARSDPGQCTPTPCPDQKVPKLTSISPTPIFMAFSGTDDSCRATMTPTTPTTTMATAAAVAASPRSWEVVPKVITITTTSRPSRNTPLNATANAVESRPLVADGVDSSSTCLAKMASSSCLAFNPAARRTALQSHRGSLESGPPPPGGSHRRHDGECFDHLHRAGQKDRHHQHQVPAVHGGGNHRGHSGSGPFTS